jgi:hypothetical protein
MGAAGAREVTCRHAGHAGHAAGGTVVDRRRRGLVPAGPIEVKPSRSTDALRPWTKSWREDNIDGAKLAIDRPEQRIELSIPSLPPDEVLLQRQ